MPRIIDRTTGRYLGTLNDQECKQLMALFDEPARTDEPLPFDPDRVDDLVESGRASDRVVAILSADAARRRAPRYRYRAGLAIHKRGLHHLRRHHRQA